MTTDPATALLTALCDLLGSPNERLKADALAIIATALADARTARDRELNVTNGARLAWYKNFSDVLQIDVEKLPGEGEKLAVLYSAVCAVKKDWARRKAAADLLTATVGEQNATIAALDKELAARKQHPCTFTYERDAEGTIIGDKCVHCENRRPASL